MPALYVVATPIGNLEDITLRAIRILKEVQLIAAEDTRKNHILLSAYGIQTPMTSYHEHNKLTKLDFILKQLEEHDVALVSDAGMPGISDPGYELIKEVSKFNIPIIPIPGPSALISSLVVSGLPTDSFVFLGFLPHKRGERNKVLKSREKEISTLVFFESPHRITESLKDILDILGDRRISVCREISKIYEEIFRGTVTQAIARFTDPRGEFTVILEGNIHAPICLSDTEIENRLLNMHKSGLGAKEAISNLASESGRTKKDLYKIWLNIC